MKNNKNQKLQNPFKTFEKTFNNIDELERFVLDYYVGGSDRYRVCFINPEIHTHGRLLPITLSDVDCWQWFIGRVARTQITPPLFEAELLEVGKLITI